MSGRTHLIIPDAHAHPSYHNKRADYLAQLIIDLKPDVVVNLGDAADMASLSSYDKGTKGFQGRSYQKDVDAYLDFQERTWGPVKARKKKLPYRIFHEGNHEQRIKRVVNYSPELEGTLDLKDLGVFDYYDKVVEYDGGTPGVNVVDGVAYAHYFISGVSGRAISSEHSAYALLTKRFQSSTQGHVHTFDYSVRTDGDGNKMMGLVAGCYQDYRSDWAGDINRFWLSGVAIKRNVYRGCYDLQWVSLDALRKEYGK